ncbi:MAG TPA: AbrB/MazE/SpoVT family DNA-binding domain-containing protein [Oceanicaulis sp.]|uniref:AbrB/MazE/SpoVT family DNA-binding domain-containing protein n=1 Tax=uncultured Sneathiella sp. TaxID=879315 RepID=UPI000ED87B1B|nr:AbrB/MazE/SpoVT family DNA-binding domain-containing protein [Oceanicaulis sp.]|tara:strand:+ start:355 stop:609 length:255 start_codon:yes stop_codon:yes gene_type:complete
MLKNSSKKSGSFKTKLRKTGSAVGATIPAEFLRQLDLKAGDKVTVNVEEDGVKIVKSDPAFEADMTHYDVIEDRFAPAFRKLAE